MKIEWKTNEIENNNESHSFNSFSFVTRSSQIGHANCSCHGMASLSLQFPPLSHHEDSLFFVFCDYLTTCLCQLGVKQHTASDWRSIGKTTKPTLHAESVKLINCQLPPTSNMHTMAKIIYGHVGPCLWVWVWSKDPCTCHCHCLFVSSCLIFVCFFFFFFVLFVFLSPSRASSLFV